MLHWASTLIRTFDAFFQASHSPWAAAEGNFLGIEQKHIARKLVVPSLIWAQMAFIFGRI